MRTRAFTVISTNNFCLIFVLLCDIFSSITSSPPYINISSLFVEGDSDQKSYCLYEIDFALKNHGLFLAYGHELNKGSLISNAHLDAKRLFKISNNLKQKYATRDDNPFRGYLKFGIESGLNQFFEPKEGFSYGYSHLNSNSNPLQV